jgi:hypothetical protein
VDELGGAAVALIPKRPFLWMTERQRQELRRASRIVADFAAAIAGDRRARPGRRLLGKLRRSCALPVARVVRR